METELHALQAETRKEKQFRAIQILFALFAVMMAYLFFNIVPLQEFPLATVLFGAVLFLLTLVFALLLGGRFRLDSALAMLFGMVCCSYWFLNGGWTWNSYYPCFIGTLIAYLYFLYTLFGNRKAGFLGSAMLLEWLQATVLYPFQSFPAFFLLFFRRRTKSGKVWKQILIIGASAVLAILLGYIVLLLLSFDPKFESLADRIFAFFTLDLDDFTEVLFKLFFAIPCGALLFGAFTSAKERKNSAFATKETAEKLSSGSKRIPVLIAALPTIVLLVIYVLFFVSQWGTYVAAFSHVVPADFSAADYARSGFFELCAVASINAALLLLMNVFCKRTPGAVNGLRKVLNVALSLFTLILIATALAKMFLYIERFDLTLSRLYPTILLFFLALAFLCEIVATFVRRFRILPVLLTVLLVGMFLFPFSQPNKRVAQFNGNAYLSRIEQGADPREIDLNYLAQSLGEAGILELDRLGKDPRTEPAVQEKIEEYLRSLANDTYDKYESGQNGNLTCDWYRSSIYTKQVLEILSTYHRASASELHSARILLPVA